MLDYEQLNIANVYENHRLNQLTIDFMKLAPTNLGSLQGAPPGPGLPQGSSLELLF